MTDWTSITPLAYITILIWRKDNGCSVGYFAQGKWFNIFDIELSDVIAWKSLPFGPKGEAQISSDLIRKKNES